MAKKNTHSILVQTRKDLEYSELEKNLHHWHTRHNEGKLAIDVLENTKEIILVTTIAGVDIDSLEVSLDNDMLTIKGQRPNPLEKEMLSGVFHTECFWGPFSRSVILPVDIDPNTAKAQFKNGILIIKIHKKRVHKRIEITIVDE